MSSPHKGHIAIIPLCVFTALCREDTASLHYLKRFVLQFDNQDKVNAALSVQDSTTANVSALKFESSINDAIQASNLNKVKSEAKSQDESKAKSDENRDYYE